MDTFEASVWVVPDTTGRNRGVVRKIQKGTVSLEDLERAGAQRVTGLEGLPGIVPRLTVDDLSLDFQGQFVPVPGSQPPASDAFAVSVAGAVPTTSLTQYQMAQLCAFSGKRLPTNQEWHAAAAGTPEPSADDGATTCNVGEDLVATGSRSACVSSWGTRDMVGNVAEVVADRAERSEGCADWNPTGAAAVRSCFGGPLLEIGFVDTEPGALVRGGERFQAGLFALSASNTPSSGGTGIGFRCVR